MDLANALDGINWLAVVVATAAAFGLGGFWYSKALFGNTWQQEVGLSDEAIAGASMPLIFGTTFVLQFLAVTALAALIGANGNWMTGLQTGLVVSIFWVATAYGITYLFEQRSLRIFLINSGYNVVLFGIVGTILGAWR